MKLNLLILLFFLLACAEQKETIPKGILSEKEFILVLKDIHLSEANIELQKEKLVNFNSLIYKKYNISEEIFKNTLDFYIKNPEKLELIYTKLLETLTEEHSTLDLQ